MYARVYDKKNDRYYKSIVYCGIDQGFYRKYVVLNPHTGNFELVDHLDQKDSRHRPLVEIIRSDSDGWKKYENAFLLKHKAWYTAHGGEMPFQFLWGYPDVCEKYEFISAVAARGSVPAEEAGIEIRHLPEDGWKEIRTQADAEEFMKLFAYFHDSTLESLSYQEGSGSAVVQAVFDNRGWYGIAELCFEAVRAVNLRPAGENYSCEIWEASLVVRNEEVLWADWCIESDGMSVDGSYIKALNLKWRKIG